MLSPTDTSSPETHLSFFLRFPWNRRWFWYVLSGLILVADYFAGPFILFPILFIFPVMLAGWNCARRDAIFIALLLTAFRFAFQLAWIPAWTIGTDTLNTVVRGIVLVTLGVLTWRVADQNRELSHQVSQLEGLVRICAHCKRILDQKNHWTELETYIVQHSQAEFTHGVCPECAKKYYGITAPNEAAF